jgi:hypothetical protein
MLSDISTLCLLLCIVIDLIYIKRLTKDVYPYSIRRDLRSIVNKAYVINIVSFAFVAILFYKIYNAIADDGSYYGGEIPVTGNLILAGSGTSFMQILTGYIRMVTGMDIFGFHILFAAISFAAGLLFIRLFLLHIELKNLKLTKNIQLSVWALLCFPNIMAWGRFYGKDSIMVVFAAIWVYNTEKILFSKVTFWNYAGIIISGFCMFKIRPHIAASFFLAFLVVFFLKLFKSRKMNPAISGIVKLIGPYLFIAMAIAGAYFAAVQIGGTKSVDKEALTQTFQGASTTGAYGGSSRKMSVEEDEGGAGVLAPMRIITNIAYLYLAPFPWQIRGAIDIIALVSNILFLYLLWKFYKNINYKLLFHIYMIAIIGMLTMLLSFLTGNVGLILREKTILLPFLFLLLFTNKDCVETQVLKKERGRKPL